MKFEEALKAMRDGNKIYRKHYGDRVFYTLEYFDDWDEHIIVSCTRKPYVEGVACNVQDYHYPASFESNDVLADDWCSLEEGSNVK